LTCGDTVHRSQQQNEDSGRANRPLTACAGRGSAGVNHDPREERYDPSGQAVTEFGAELSAVLKGARREGSIVSDILWSRVGAAPVAHSPGCAFPSVALRPGC